MSYDTFDEPDPIEYSLSQVEPLVKKAVALAGKTLGQKLRVKRLHSANMIGDILHTYRLSAGMSLRPLRLRSQHMGSIVVEQREGSSQCKIDVFSNLHEPAGFPVEPKPNVNMEPDKLALHIERVLVSAQEVRNLFRRQGIPLASPTSRYKSRGRLRPANLPHQPAP